mgnify:CR=1 FL=1
MSLLPSDISTEAMKKRYAFDGIRAQIRDLRTENIAVLAARARELGDVIPLWFGEGDVVVQPKVSYPTYEIGTQLAGDLVDAGTGNAKAIRDLLLGQSRDVVIPGDACPKVLAAMGNRVVVTHCRPFERGQL